MLDLIWLIPALPLAGFLHPRRVRPSPRRSARRLPRDGDARRLVRRHRHRVLRPARDGRRGAARTSSTLYEWMPVGALHVDMAFLADPLSIAMCLFVTGVGTLIHLYSIGYMHGDPKFSKFFCYLNLFAFSMLVLVLGENMVVTFLGWEGVGTCSYLLISFWHTRRVGGDGRQEGVHHQPRRRLGLHGGDVPRLRRRRLAQLLRSSTERRSRVRSPPRRPRRSP